MAKTANDRLTIDQRLEKLGRQRELVHRIKKTGIVCIVALFGSGFLLALLSIIGIFDDPPEFFTVIIVVLFVLAFVLTLVGYYNPCDNCRIPPKEKKEMAIIPSEKLGVYLSEAEKYGVLPMFFLELSSGLRRGELLALRWDDLNVKDRILSVSKQVTRIDGELLVTEPKTKNSVRKVALSQQAVALLVREHEQHPDNPILFPSPRTGGYWSPDAVSRINRKLLAKAGIEEHVRFHDLRHTFATMALSSGVDVKTLSSMLGHYSAGFTLDTYTHITNDMQRGAAEKIGGFMETATAKPEPEPPDPPEESRCKVIPFEKVG